MTKKKREGRRLTMHERWQSDEDNGPMFMEIVPGLTYDQAVEILRETCDMQPSEALSEYRGGVWYLRNAEFFLGCVTGPPLKK